MMIYCIGMIAQKAVSGIVKDQKGEAIIGASVLVQGTDIGTISDFDGSFSIQVPADKREISISYVGYTEQSIDITGNDYFEVILIEGAVLDEVVVTALGISRSSKSLGYGASSVSTELLNETKNVSALDALNGRIPGVSISTASGAPGASTIVNIRGFTSVTGNNQPLFVVDGVPLNNRGNTSSTNALNTLDDFNRSMDFGNQMNDINPNDIESMTILKGSAGSALYGSRAANGVIIIKTKKGNTKKLSVSMDLSWARQDILRVPHQQNTYGQGWSGLFAYEENGSWGPRADNKLRLWGNNVNNSQQLKPFSIQKNNLRDFFDYGNILNSGISIGAGDEKSNYRFSYAWANADGVVPTNADSYKRHTFGFNGGTKINKFGMNSSINYINKNQKAVATGQGDDAGGGKVLWQEMIQVPRDHSIIDYKKYNDINDPASEFYSLDNFFTPYAQNPYWTLYNQGNNYDEDRLFGNIEMSYDFSNNLSLLWRGGADASNAQQKDWGNLGIITPGTPNSTANNVAGSVAEITRKNQQFNSDLVLNWKKDYSDKFNVNALVGHNINTRTTGLLISKVTDLVLSEFYNLSNSTVTPITQTLNTNRRLMGIYGQVSFGYDQWMYLTLGARNDWSSTLPINANSYFYPNASLSLVLSEKLSLPAAIDYLKVRSSVAQTGNDADPYQVDPVYLSGITRAGGNANVNFPFGGVSSFEVSNTAGNPNLKPEITKEFEVGLETKLFKDRISVDVNYFNKLTKNQIINLLVEGATGYTNQTVNLGSVRNTGIELMVGFVPVRSKNFEWSFSANYFKIKNNVESLGLSDDTEILLNASYDVDLKAVVGQPLGALYSPQPATNDAGQIIVNPSTGLPLLSSEKAFRGTINPDFTVGVSSQIKYKRLSLGGNADYRKGGVFYSYTARLNYFVGNAWNTQYNDRQPWVIPNSVTDNGDGTYKENTTPISRANVFAYYGASDPYQFNHVLDRTFFKLRNLYLNYDLPTSVLNKLHISKSTLGIFGRNLVLWTPEENHFVDPESNSFGTNLNSLYGEFSTGPSTATYGVQLNLTF